MHRLRQTTTTTTTTCTLTCFSISASFESSVLISFFGSLRSLQELCLVNMLAGNFAPTFVRRMVVMGVDLLDDTLVTM